MNDPERDREAAGGPLGPKTGPDSDPPETVADGEPVSVDVQSYIGVQLRAVYDDVAQQPIPDRFLDLMRRLG